MSTDKPAILITPHSAHVALVETLRYRGHRVIVFGDATFNQYFNVARDRAQEQANDLATHWLASLQVIFSEYPLHLSGRDMTQQLASQLAPILLNNFLSLQATISAIEALHRDLPLGLCIVHNDVAPTLRALIAVADRHSIPSLHLPHGLAVGRLPIEDGTDLIRATRVGAEGAYARDVFLLNPKNRASQIALVGRPEWDTAAPLPPASRIQACHELGLDPTRPVIGFAGSWGSPLTTYDTPGILRIAFREFLLGVRQLEQEHPQVLVRLHPGHRYVNDFGAEWHRAIASELGISLFIQEDTDTRERFFAASDLVVGFESTLLVEALLAGRHSLAIHWQQMGTGSRSFYAHYPGMATCRPEAEAIASALRSCLWGDAFRARLQAGREETIAQLNFRNDGRATERTIALIERMLAGDLDADTSLVANLPNRRGRNLVAPFVGREALVAVLEAYLATFSSESDVALHVLAGANLPEAEEAILQALEALGRNPEEIPDISLLDAPATPDDLAAYLRAGDLVIAPPDLAQLARELGRPSLSDPQAETLRSAVAALDARPAIPVTRDPRAPQTAPKPVFAPETAPADLPDRAEFNLVVDGSDEALLDATLSAYLEAFAPGDRTCLHVLAGTNAEALQNQVLEVLARLSLDPAHIPDVSLLDAPTTPLELPRYLASADLVIGTETIARGARDLRRPAFQAPGAELLRTAYTHFKDLDWHAESPAIETRATERWLCATSWKEALATFLAPQAQPSRALLVPVAPGQAERTLEAIAEWLSLHGYDPEAIPDVLLLEQTAANTVGLFRAANVWIESGDPAANAVASALGLRIVPAQEGTAGVQAPAAERPA